MKLNAKWVTVSFLAASVLGAWACTVTTGTTDTTSGTSSSGGSSSGGSSSGSTSSSSGSTSSSGGTDSGATCEGNTQTTTAIPPACQSCLNANCCNELKGCFNQPAGTSDAGVEGVDCNKYAECEIQCNSDPDAGDPAQCEDLCKTAASQGIQDAYQAILNCGKTNGCATECGIQ